MAMTNSLYIVGTDFFEGPGVGHVFIAAITINADGVILYDPSRYHIMNARSHFAPAVFEVHNSPYIIWVADGTGGSGNINIAPITINADGIPSIDSSRIVILHLEESGGSNFTPAAFVFNNSPYIVWTSRAGNIGEAGNINIAPITISTNGEISYDLSRRVYFRETGANAFAVQVFVFNNSPYIVWRKVPPGPINPDQRIYIAPIALNNSNGTISVSQLQVLGEQSAFPFAAFVFNNSPYMIQGTAINIAPITINVSGPSLYISIDSSRRVILPEHSNTFGAQIPIPSGCTAFEFNNTLYIVWIGSGGNIINIAPIAINTNGIISYDPSRKFVIPPFHGPNTRYAISPYSIVNLSS
jgi:hypothetical protein